MTQAIATWLIILTCWSAIIWLIARALPEKALAWPTVWLGLIAASLAPAIIAPILPRSAESILTILPVTIALRLPAPAPYASPEAAFSWPLILSVTYLLVALLLLVRIFFAYIPLWRIAAKAGRDGIATSPLIATPVATALPFRAILLPEGLEGLPREMIVRHEARHLDRKDPEIILVLELLRALMWVNLPFRALIRRWRLSAELAVDTDILSGSTPQQRQAYANLLINELSRIRRQAVPCPSAALTLSEERSAKMRVSNILSPASGMRKSTKAAVAAVTVCLSAVGSVFAATATGNVPVVSDANAVPATSPAPVFPEECTIATGDDAQVEILLQYDIDRDGNVIEPKIIRSSDSCFNNAVLSAVRDWKYDQVFVDGVAARRENVRTVFRFKIEPSDQSEEN